MSSLRLLPLIFLFCFGGFCSPASAHPAWPSTYFNNSYAEMYTVPYGLTAIIGPQPVTVWATDNNIRITTGTSLLDKILGASGLDLPSGFPGSPNTLIITSNQQATYLVGDVDANNSPQPNSMYEQQGRSSSFGGMIVAIFNSDWDNWLYIGSSVEGHWYDFNLHWEHRYAFASITPLEAGTLTCTAPLDEPWKITPDAYVSLTNQIWVDFSQISYGSQDPSYFQPPPGANPLITGKSSNSSQPFSGNLPAGTQQQPNPPVPGPPYPWSPIQ